MPLTVMIIPYFRTSTNVYVQPGGKPAVHITCSQPIYTFKTEQLKKNEKWELFIAETRESITIVYKTFFLKTFHNYEQSLEHDIYIYIYIHRKSGGGGGGGMDFILAIYI